MSSKKNESENSTNPEYIQKFHDIHGLDMVAFYLNDESVVGYLDKSPIEEKIISKFNYVPNNNAIKPYRAHWMVYDSELLLGYVNGIIDGKRFYSRDVLEECGKDEILHHYHYYSGQLKLNIQQQKIHPVFEPYLINKNELLIKVHDGIVQEVKVKVIHDNTDL
jgi:hypothetical protein